jgi:hypothetical protein
MAESCQNHHFRYVVMPRARFIVARACTKHCSGSWRRTSRNLQSEVSDIAVIVGAAQGQPSCSREIVIQVLERG